MNQRGKNAPSDIRANVLGERRVAHFFFVAKTFDSLVELKLSSDAYESDKNLIETITSKVSGGRTEHLPSTTLCTAGAVSGATNVFQRPAAKIGDLCRSAFCLRGSGSVNRCKSREISIVVIMEVEG